VEQRELDNTGVRLSAIGLGCMGMVGWYGSRDDREARATVDRALSLGVTHFDTAAVYQDGANERFVGDCIRGRRDRVFLATKCGMQRGADGKLETDNRPETIRASCDASLERLGVEHIDLFYLHRIDPDVPLEDSIGAMADLVAAGKVGFVGLSEASVDTLRRAHEMYPVAALQSELSLWTRESAQPALDACRELGLAFVAYSPLGRGFLTGAIRSRDDLVTDDTRRLFPRFDDDNLRRNQPVAERVQVLAERFGCTPAQLALAWVLAQWRGVLPIPGVKTREHLEDNIGALDLELSVTDLDFIASSLPEELVYGERYPESMMQTVNV
jgi:aryl-alcohol dehydrogenase-like predicted oxidoreductase